MANDHLVELGSGFWNVRGSFKLLSLVEIGTQCSLVQLTTGGFALLDAYAFTGAPEREIARLTSTMPGTLSRELALLTGAGLLSRTRTGNQVSYQANTSSPIFGELASIARKTFGLADVLKDALAPLADRIESAFVFGSAASGKTTAGSRLARLHCRRDRAVRHTCGAPTDPHPSDRRITVLLRCGRSRGV